MCLPMVMILSLTRRTHERDRARLDKPSYLAEGQIAWSSYPTGRIRTGHLCRRPARRVAPSPIMPVMFSMPGMLPPGAIMLSIIGAAICMI